MLETYQYIELFCIILGFCALFWQLNLYQKNNLKNTSERFVEQHENFKQLSIRLEEREKIYNEMRNEMREKLTNLLKEQKNEQSELRNQFDKHQLESLKSIIDTLQKSSGEIRNQIYDVLRHNTQTLGERLNKLTEDTNLRLKEINTAVEQRLSKGFEKTTETFTDVIKRLALIDEAQKKITELSGNVVSLKDILADKRSRGAFGEVQLASLLRNVLPENQFSLQHTLSNNKRADCLLFLPYPNGNMVIDSKFPLESFQILSDFGVSEIERTQAKQRFQNDVKKHINDISEKYIIEGETADCALMFIPAEAIFAEIHAHHPELVDLSHRKKTWMVSPTTMMAILTATRASLKDAATQKQANLIREHLLQLNVDFKRFQERMDNLAKHVNQAHTDVEEVYKASKKISVKFSKIERVEIGQQDLGKEREQIEEE